MKVNEKETILVKRKNTRVVRLFKGSPIPVPVVVTSYDAGPNVHYKFPFEQSVFEVSPRDLPKILSRCDMEVISSIEYNRIKAVADSTSFNDIEVIHSLEDALESKREE